MVVGSRARWSRLRGRGQGSVMAQLSVQAGWTALEPGGELTLDLCSPTSSLGVLDLDPESEAKARAASECGRRRAGQSVSSDGGRRTKLDVNESSGLTGIP